jgi:hypothetical protein
MDVLYQFKNNFFHNFRKFVILGQLRDLASPTHESMLFEALSFHLNCVYRDLAPHSSWIFQARDSRICRTVYLVFSNWLLLSPFSTSY